MSNTRNLVICENCKTTQASAFCKGCDQTLCDSCVQRHTTAGLTSIKDHQIVQFFSPEQRESGVAKQVNPCKEDVQVSNPGPDNQTGKSTKLFERMDSLGINQSDEGKDPHSLPVSLTRPNEKAAFSWTGAFSDGSTSERVKDTGLFTPIKVESHATFGSAPTFGGTNLQESKPPTKIFGRTENDFLDFSNVESLRRQPHVTPIEAHGQSGETGDANLPIGNRTDGSNSTSSPAASFPRFSGPPRQ